METFQENIWKPIHWHILALLRAKTGPKIWPMGAIFHSNLKVPTICLYTKFMVPYLFFFEKMAKKLKNSPFHLFCFKSKIHWKIIRKKSKFYFNHFLANIIMRARIESNMDNWWIFFNRWVLSVTGIAFDQHICHNIQRKLHIWLYQFMDILFAIYNMVTLWHSGYRCHTQTLHP